MQRYTTNQHDASTKHTYSLSKQFNVTTGSIITLEKIGMIFDIINTSNTYEELWFFNATMNDEHLKKIASLLSDNEKITSLAICNPKQLTDGSGVKAIATILRTNTTLKQLSLKNCRINEESAIYLAESIAKNSTLTELILDMNSIGSYATKCIMEAFDQHPRPTHLSLNKTDSADNLNMLANAIANNQSITALELSSNLIPDHGATLIANALGRNSTLRTLSVWSLLEIQKAGCDALEKAFKKNHWMDKIEINLSNSLTRTPTERTLQLERESPARNYVGTTITLAAIRQLSKTFNPPHVALNAYLEERKNQLNDDTLSYVDILTLFQLISQSTPHQPTKLIKQLCPDPFFSQLFSRLNELALLTEKNFKTFYLLSDDERTILYRLLCDPDTIHSQDNQLLYPNEIRCMTSLFLDAKPTLNKLFNTLINTIDLRKNDFLPLLSLSQKNIVRLNQVVESLAKNKLLNNDSYKTALERISFKQPTTTLALVTKKSRTKTENQIKHSQLVIDNKLTLFLEHNDKKEYLSGGMGYIKKGYMTDDALGTLPTHSVKKFNLSTNSQKRSLRNTKFNKLMGREAYCFERNGIFTTVSTWQTGKSLNQYTEKALITKTPLTRFRCVMDGLEQIEKCHRIFYIHGDIKPDNFIIDFTKQQMSLIDFDGARKKGSRTAICYTTQYCENADRIQDKPETQSFCDDIYSMGLTICELFPELLSTKNGHLKIIKSLTQITSSEYAIIRLVQAMLTHSRTARCTSENGLRYCQAILSNINNLTQQTVDEIAQETLFSQKITVEDVLRGKTSLKR